MGHVAITGAAGDIGRLTLAELDEHTLTPIIHRPHDDIEGLVLDVADREAVVDALEGADVVFHLAANPSPSASWDEVRGPNVEGTYNVYHAAAEHDLERVVFASTNHVVHAYNASESNSTGGTVPDPRPVYHDDVPRPDSFYGVSKVAGEALGSYYADRHGLEVVNLRIGWLLTPEELREKQSLSEDRARHARAMWLSPRDCRDALRCSVEASLAETPLTVNLVSRNTDRYLSLTHAMRALGYRPRDDSAEVLETREED